MLKKFAGNITFLLILIAICTAQADAGLEKKIDDIRTKLKKVDFAVKIVHAKTGTVVYQQNPKKPMTPASNMKIITSAAALKYLGPNYRFTTKIGLLDDAVAVIGGGDPLLGDEKTDNKYGRENGWIFEDITSVLKDNGVTSVKDIVIDSTFFDDNRVRQTWPKDQLNRWYACEISGLNYNGNCIGMTVQRSGRTAKITLMPDTDYVTTVNKVRLISKGNSAVGAYRNSHPNNLVVRGNCRKKTGFDVAIERPAAFFGFMLAENLSKNGISVDGALTEKYIKKDRRIRIIKQYHTSLEDVLARCNKNSFGLTAESLVKTISAENTDGRINGEWDHGLSLIGRYLTGLGVGDEEFNLDDGSGLSQENKLSPNAITRVLLDVYNSDNWQMYKDSLAVAGVDGTISKYFYEKKYKGRIFGKTGYINRVKSFSGVCSTENGDYVFSILANGANGTTRKAINDIAKAIIDTWN